MVAPNALVICGDGINCDAETTLCLELAGFKTTRMHITDLLDNPALLSNQQLLAIPGGFSFGDEIASGKVLAIKLKQKVNEALHKFVDDNNLVIGICNGFQVLVRMGFLPFSERQALPMVSLNKNKNGKFINCWVDVIVDHNVPCRFFDTLETFQLPIRHGEGRLVLGLGQDAQIAETVKQHAALRYKEDVNGSFDRIAALTNTNGNVLGLMPHPEAFVRWTQHPAWCYQKINSKATKSVSNDSINDVIEPPGLVIMRNAAKMLSVG